MSYIKVHNKSGFKVDFKAMAQKLKPYLSLVDKKYYPLIINVIKKKHKLDRSNFDLNTNTLLLKIDTSYQSEQEIAWIIFHEFWHFIEKNNKEIYKIAFSEENALLEELFKRVFKLSDDKMTEIMHDFFSYEIGSNFFATMLAGKFFKRHSVEIPKKLFSKKGITIK